MRIARLRYPSGPVRWTVVEPERDRATPLRGQVADWAGAVLGDDPLDASLLADEAVALSSTALLAPLEPTAKVICIGLNYRSHVEAFPNATMPSRPLGFLKANTAVIAHGDDLVYPPLTSALDYEIELVVVIGRPIGPHDPPEQAVLGADAGTRAGARIRASDGREEGMATFLEKRVPAEQ